MAKSMNKKKYENISKNTFLSEDITKTKKIKIKKVKKFHNFSTSSTGTTSPFGSTSTSSFGSTSVLVLLGLALTIYNYYKKKYIYI